MHICCRCCQHYSRHPFLCCRSNCSGTPRLVRSGANAKLFHANNATGIILPIVHVYGTPYEMGLAQGQLMRLEIVQMYTAFEA